MHRLRDGGAAVTEIEQGGGDAGVGVGAVAKRQA